MTYLRHQIVFFLLSPLLHLYVRLSYHFKRVPYSAPLKRGAKFILANHNCNVDPFMIAASFSEPIYFVASDHLFRKGWVSAIIRFLVAPIPIVKSQIDLRTLRTIRETLADNRVVCLFPEGNRSFSGQTGRISPATGKLVRQLKSPLVLYRIHGGYLSTPRWGSKRRKGRMTGEIARVLSTDELAALNSQEIQQIIEETLYVDAYEHQCQLDKPVAFKGPALAEHLERTLFVCPACHGIDTLHSHNDHFTCLCGFDAVIDVYGFFHPHDATANNLATAGHFFITVAAWDDWQISWLRSVFSQKRSTGESDDAVETDDTDDVDVTGESAKSDESDMTDVTEWRSGTTPIIQDQNQRMTMTQRASHDQSLGCGTLALFSDRLEFTPQKHLEGANVIPHASKRPYTRGIPAAHDPADETQRFPLSRISRMIVHGSQTLQFSLDDQQTYEVHSAHPRSAYQYTVLFDLLAPNLKKT